MLARYAIVGYSLDNSAIHFSFKHKQATAIKQIVENNFLKRRDFQAPVIELFRNMMIKIIVVSEENFIDMLIL